jgi:hypothetical protein
MHDVNIGDDNAFLNDVKVGLDMLHTLLLDGVGREVDESDLWQRSMEFLEELPEPTSFGHTISHGAILNLDAWSRDDVLALGALGDMVITEEHSVARGGLACIRATCPSHIRVDRQLRGGGRAS